VVSFDIAKTFDASRSDFSLSVLLDGMIFVLPGLIVIGVGGIILRLALGEYRRSC
jgi:hypothetical protein